MSSIMRWRNGLMGLSVMAITPVSHEVSEPHDLETGRAILFIPTSNPPRARSRWGVYRESGLVLGSIPPGDGALVVRAPECLQGGKAAGRPGWPPCGRRGGDIVPRRDFTLSYRRRGATMSRAILRCRDDCA